VEGISVLERISKTTGVEKNPFYVGGNEDRLIKKRIRNGGCERPIYGVRGNGSKIGGGGVRLKNNLERRDSLHKEKRDPDWEEGRKGGRELDLLASYIP